MFNMTCGILYIIAGLSCITKTSKYESYYRNASFCFISCGVIICLSNILKLVASESALFGIQIVVMIYLNSLALLNFRKINKLMEEEEESNEFLKNN